MKPKAAKTGAEPNGEPALADVKITAKSEDAPESQVKGSKGDKPDNVS